MEQHKKNSRAAKNSNHWGLVALFAMLHLLCYGIPLLILSGVSLGLVFPRWPVIGVALAVVGFVWYLKRGCATCPRNEGRCMAEGHDTQQTPADCRNR